jgi:hypothetical protein
MYEFITIHIGQSFNEGSFLGHFINVCVTAFPTNIY